MALETTSIPQGIRPLSRPNLPSGTDGVARRDEGSSAGFSPRTDLAIKNSVEDMAGILAKISSDRVDTMQKIPADLQQVVENIMKNAFSLENSLLQGFGSSLESQRFSLEQLQIFARMLTQLGVLADKGFTTDFSEPMQTLLTNLKNYLSQETGGALEPVLLNKFAFELIDTKNVTDLPPALQELLTGQQMPAVSNETGDALAMLKQLVRYFMPRAGTGAGQNLGGGTTGNFPGAASNAPNAFGSANQSGGTGQGFAPNSAAQNLGGVGTSTGANQWGNGQADSSAPGVNMRQGTNFAGNSPGTANLQGNVNAGANNPGQPWGQQMPTGNQGQPANMGENFAPTSTGGNNMANDSMAGVEQSGGRNMSALTGNSASADGTPMNGRMAQADGSPRQNANVGNQPPQPTGAESSGGRTAEDLNLNELREWLTRRGSQRQAAPTAEENMSPLQQAKNQILRTPMQNIPPAMDTMKSLAQLLLRNAPALTVQDAEILQNFVNGQETTLGERDARQLQTLLRICQQNIPASVQQAAIQQNLPDLPRLWAFMQLCDMSLTKNMNGPALKKAGKSVGEFTNSVKRSTAGGNSVVQGKRSLNFMLPLFFGDETTSYPAYVHVYDEDAVDKYSGEWKKETWLRICLLTDNIGAVEMVCRIYEGQQLDVRLFFSDRNTAQEFREYLPELRRDMRGNTKLRLRELKVGAAGERRFL